MRKYIYTFLVMAATLFQSACAITLQQPFGAPQTYNTLEFKTFVKVRNNCAPFIRIEGLTRTYADKLPIGQPYTVILTRKFGEATETIITVTGFDKDGNYFGSVDKKFRFDPNRDRVESWTVDRLMLPGGKGGCPK